MYLSWENIFKILYYKLKIIFIDLESYLQSIYRVLVAIIILLARRFLDLVSNAKGAFSVETPLSHAIHNNMLFMTLFIRYFISMRHLSSIARNALILGSCTFSRMAFCRSTSDLSIVSRSLSAYLIQTQFAHPDMQQLVGSAKSSIEVSFAIRSSSSFRIDEFRRQ